MLTYGPYCTRTLQVSQFCMERSVLPVPITAVWSGLSPENLYKTPSSCGSGDTILGHKDRYIPGRYPSPGQLQEPADRRFGFSGQAVGGVGVHTQSEEVHLVTDTNHRILGVHSQFHSNDDSPSSRQDGENQEGVQTCVSQTGSDGTSAGTLSRTPFIFNSSDRTSPSPLPCLAETSELCTAAGQGELRLPNKDGSGIHERSSVVDSRGRTIFKSLEAK